MLLLLNLEFLMKNLFAGSLIVISMISAGVLPANAQRVDYGGYSGGGGGTPAPAPQPAPVAQTNAPPASSGKAGQIQNLLSINGLTPVACGFGVAKMIFPGLGEVCITAQPGKFESGATYSYDQASNSINRVGAASVNNGPAGQATVNTGNQPQVVPVQPTQPQVVPIANQQTDLEFALQTLQKNGMVNTVCTPETAQFFVAGKLTVCGNPTAQIGKGQYNINR
jgi:hypothetical protein